MARTAVRTLDPAAICRASDPLAVRELLSHIGDKWTIFVVLTLDLPGGRARFSELERAVPGISQRMLTVTLRSLERDGLVTREVFPEVAAAQGLVDWAKAHWETVRASQASYDVS